MQKFGTDGIRGIYKSTLFEEDAYALGYALSLFGKRLVVARDTRISGERLKRALALGFSYLGGEVFDGGILPTPALFFGVKALDADFGVEITASHNPPEYNGLKVFSREGKPSRDFLNLVEEKMKKVPENRNLSSLHPINLAEGYINFLLEKCGNLKGLKIALDTANGACSPIAGKVFEKLGAEVVLLSNKGDGNLINQNCGALFPQSLQKAVVENNCHFGFAFDGDGDRVIGVTQKGELFDGDSILFALGKAIKEKGLLCGNAIVATKVSSFALEEKLNEEGITLFYSEVGDSAVAEEMKNRNLILGGEKAGHILLDEGTGDGLKIALALSQLLKSGFDLESCLLPTYPRFEKNLPLSATLSTPLFYKKVEKVKDILKGKGKIIVRPSGTEPLLRILIETKDEALLSQAVKILGCC